MQHETELAAAVHAAMKKQNLNKSELADRLKLSPVMLEKLLCGKILPSRHLEKQLVEELGISRQRVTKLAERREKKSAAGSAASNSAEQKPAKRAAGAKP
jgi:transcriptional regulator with XRE-family HTH domain